MAALGTTCALLPSATVAAPPERAFELVTPADEGTYNPRPVGSRGDGSALYWGSGQGQGIGDPADDDASAVDVYIARRGTTAWESTWLTPDPTPNSATQFFPGTEVDGLIYRTTWDAAPNDQNAGDILFNPVYDLYRSDDGSTMELLSAAPGGASGPLGIGALSAMALTPDLDAVAFESPDPLVPEDGDNDVDVYLRKGTQLILVSRNTDGTPANGVGGASLVPLPPNAAVAASGFPASQGMSPLSTSGDVVVFSTAGALDPADQDSIADLYMWRNGQVELISDSTLPAADCSTTSDDLVFDPMNGFVPAPECRARFAGMAGDGSRIYFSTAEQLTADDTDDATDIYEYRPDGTPALRLATGDGDAAVRPVAVSRSGDLFFRSADQLGVDPPGGGADVVYRWRGGEIRTVSALSPADPKEDQFFNGGGYNLNDGIEPGSLDNTQPLYRAARASFDGDALLFATRRQIDPGDTDNQVDIYLWRAGQGITWISAGGNGPYPAQIGGPLEANNSGFGGRVINADATRVFFTSADALAPGAADNGRPKVYVWEDGELALLSPKGNARPAMYIDNSESGDDAFFQTSQPLVSADVDGDALDIYNARVGVAFTYPPPESGPGAPVQGVGGAGAGGSQGADAPSLPSLEPAPEAAGPSQPGPAISPESPTVKLAGDPVVARRAVRLVADVSGPGSLHVVIRERRDDRRVLARTRTSVDREGGKRLRVRLTRHGKRSLTRSGAVRATVVLTFVAEDGRRARARQRVVLERTRREGHR